MINKAEQERKKLNKKLLKITYKEFNTDFISPLV